MNDNGSEMKEKSKEISEGLRGPQNPSAPQVTKEEYKTMTEKASPPSPFLKNALMAFLIGGAICCRGEALAQMYMAGGLDEKNARALVSVTLVGLSAILTAFGVYDNIARVAGAGTLVPITGFANSVVSPAMEFQSEGFITGLGAKMFIVAGPVLVYGISAATLYGLILWIFRLA